MHEIVGQVSARSGSDQLLLGLVLPLEGTQACILVRDEETIVEEVEHSLRVRINDDFEHVEQLGCHTHFVLVNQELHHCFERDWALLVQCDMDRCRPLSWLVQLGATVEEDEREHVHTRVIGALLSGDRHSILHCTEHLDVRCVVVEDGDTGRESSDRTERTEMTLRDFVLVFQDLESLPVEKIRKRDEMVDTAWGSDVQVARPVLGDTPHAFNLSSQGTLWHSVSFILHIEELDWQVGVQAHDRTIVHEVVEVLLLEVGLSANDQVFGEDVGSVGRLVKTMLPIALQVPCDEVNTAS